MIQDFVHVTRTAPSGWVVVGLGGSRSVLFASHDAAVTEACRQACTADRSRVGVRMQDAKGRWLTHECAAVAPDHG